MTSTEADRANHGMAQARRYRRGRIKDVRFLCALLVVASCGSPPRRQKILPPNGAGTYQLAGSSYISLAASVTIPAAGDCAGNTRTADLRSPKESCSGCSVEVTDADPAAPYPKTLAVSIACPNACGDDTYVCTPPINIQFSQTCTR